MGVVLSAGAVFLLILAIIEGNSHGWTSVRTLASFAGSGLLMFLFALAEMRAPTPRIEPSFFRNRAFAVAASVRFAAGFGYVPVVLMSTLYLQTFLHKSPVEAGLMFMPAGVIIVVTTPFWGRIINYTGPKWPMIIGMSIAGVAAALWLRFDAQSGYGYLLISLVLASFGGAAAFVTTTVVAMNTLGVDKAGVASGIVSMLQNVSAALEVSAVSLSSLSVGLTKSASNDLFQQVQAFGPTAGDIPQAEAFSGALADAAIVVAVVMFLGAAAAFFLPGGRTLLPQGPTTPVSQV